MVEEDRSREEVDRPDELARALGLLKPQASSIDRDCFLFLAGRAAAEADRSTSRFGKWAWPASTFLSTAAALVLLGVLVTRPAAMPTVAGTQAPPSAAVVARVPDSPMAAPAANAVSPNSQTPSEEIADTGRTAVHGWLAGLGFAASSRPRRLQPYVLASRGTSLDETVTTEQPASPQSPIEEPRSQRELLEDFLKANAPAMPAAENPAG